MITVIKLFNILFVMSEFLGYNYVHGIFIYPKIDFVE